MIDRVKKLLEMEQLSPSQFADEINLQRSSLSHVLSGRNKPSLDFVMKIKQRFSEINLDWLIFGTGQMFLSRLENELVSNTPLPVKEEIIEESQKAIDFSPKSESQLTENATEIKSPVSNIELPILKSSSGRANKVIIFYNDGTFEEYTSNQLS